MHEAWPGELKVLGHRGIPYDRLHTAYQKASQFGMTAAEYLVHHEIVSESAVYSALAEHCSIPFVPEKGFRPQSVNSIPVGLGSQETGPLLIGVGTTQPYYVIAPAFAQFSEVKSHLERFPDLAGQVRMTTPSAVRHATTVLNTPAGDLESRFPELSARMRLSSVQSSMVLAVLLAFVSGLMLSAGVMLNTVIFLFSLNCFLTGGSRLVSALVTVRKPLGYTLPTEFSDPDIRWPDYTVLVPLYREAEIVPDLIKALQKLDYPTEKLDIRFLLEKDDQETRQEFAGLLPSHMQIINVPDGFPRTKPRALSHGLEGASGELVTIYDAEDRPDPDQLKKAAVFFALGAENIACLQARLAIDNHDESFFARQFALEYACLFDQLIPWFHKKQWPFPLGGTSNHFRRALLDKVGGWDKYNVTEDADLGVRLARFGYECGVLPSTTHEEAPIRWHAWLYQRTRWYKGWIQTMCVHLRNPSRTLKELGLIRLSVILAMIGGSFCMLALHPLAIVLLCGYITGFVPLPVAEDLTQKVFLTVCITGMLCGYFGAALSIWIAGSKRGYRPHIGDLVDLPFYWLCTSIAFYRAIWEFMTSPYRWNKTAHGVSIKRRQT